MDTNFGFIGLGAMGYRMAVNLRRKMAKDATLYVYDVNPTACKRFVEECGQDGPIIVATSSKAVATHCNTLLSIVPTSTNVAEVYLDPENGVVAAPARPNRLMLECSTIEIKATQDTGRKVTAAGAGIYVDAPVSGGASGAEMATVAFLVGHPDPGPTNTDPVAQRIKAFVSHMGLPERVNFCGPLGAGLVGKIVNNYISINNVLSLAEGMAFGMRYGVDKMTLYNCVKASSGDSWVLENKNSVPDVIARSPASNNFKATFPARMVLKDLGIGINAAEAVGIDASMGKNALKSFQIANDDPRTTFKDPSLLGTRAFIGGKWTAAASGATFPVHDPEDGEVAFHVANNSRDEVCQAIDAAQRAFLEYKKFSHRRRRTLLRAWTDIVRANRDDLAAICTLELGKPITESYTTVDYGLSFLDWFQGEIERLYGDTIPAAKSDNRIFTVREPQGVVAAITPWNSPIAMALRKVGAAIAAGCTVVLKPAPETPMCAIAVAKLFERVEGYPAGTLNVILGDAASSPAIGEEMCQSPLVRHLSFTGSTAVGKYLNGECGKSLKKTSMELGGNAPFIVFEDADLQKAVDGLIASKFRSSGQTCVCANRVFVHRSVIAEFAQRLEATQKKTFVYGSVWDPKVNFGPLYSQRGVNKVAKHVEDALLKGARLVSGGAVRQELGPYLYPPTILIAGENDTTKKDDTPMLFMTEETFGPVAPLIPFDSEEEVLRLANTFQSGLASYFYTESISRLWRVAEALDTGMVGVRVGLISACEQPFGGIKESGMGREGSKFGVEDYTNVKSVTLGL
ncbi:hypothetical protein SBRCBS47491_008719 [Sporothrix bragantina]|uniref:Uncharacterized protein n=1 Tax=Sporothrix bragantina TaxID=671064 RepID=A0ABP0CPD3_9PEZI